MRKFGVVAAIVCLIISVVSWEKNLCRDLSSGNVLARLEVLTKMNKSVDGTKVHTDDLTALIVWH